MKISNSLNVKRCFVSLMLIMDILPYFIIFEIFYSCEVSNCDLLGYDTMQTSN